MESNHSLVIFDNLNQQFGVILHHNITADMIEQICENLHHEMDNGTKKTHRHQSRCIIQMVH